MHQSLKQWFSHGFLDLFQSQIRDYQKVVTDRILPTFSRIEQEAEEFAQRESERMSELVHPEIDDSDFTEVAYDDRVVDYYLSLCAIHHGMINLLTAGLFHLFEQQVTRFVDNSAHKAKANKKLFERFKKVLQAGNCGAQLPPHWEKLSNELRLVANTVKHGRGHSAKKLASQRPDLFSPRNLNLDEAPFPPHGDNATAPLVGEGLFVTEKDFKDYAEAIIAFWDALSCWVK